MADAEIDRPPAGMAPGLPPPVPRSPRRGGGRQEIAFHLAVRAERLRARGLVNPAEALRRD